MIILITLTQLVSCITLLSIFMNITRLHIMQKNNFESSVEVIVMTKATGSRQKKTTASFNNVRIKSCYNMRHSTCRPEDLFHLFRM